MSKSVKISKPIRTIPYTELVQMIVAETSINPRTVQVVLACLVKIVTQSLLKGCAVNIKNFFTFHLRRRDYSEERRKNFNMGNASLPEFCYYPYAEPSANLRKDIAAHKQQINDLQTSEHS